MPIYAYKCGSCGHAKDVLQKISDTPLTVCPACGAEAFTKQITAAGFQLKGSGWYVTDFRGGNNGAKPADSADAKGGDAPAAGAAAAPAPASADAPKKETPSASAASAPTASTASTPKP